MASSAQVHPQQGCVVFAKDKARVSRFYQQALGLVAEESEPSHDLLRGNGYEVVVHSIPSRHATLIQIAQPVQLREDTPIKPSFVVADLEAVRLAAANTGGHLRSLESAWRIRGFIVLDGWDPEGNVLQFKQPE